MSDLRIHVGRSWIGTRLEDGCPCEKEPCGLVDMDKADPSCEQHGIDKFKTMRQMHNVADCPGAKT